MARLALSDSGMKGRAWFRWLIAAVVVFLAGVAVSLKASADEKKAKGDEITATCGQCHEDVAQAFAKNAHRSLGAVCTDCHGNTQQHTEEGGALDTIVTFTAKGKQTSLRNTEQCLTCHKTSVSHYLAGPHGKASMDCGQCHAVHAPAGRHLLKADPGKLCASCHQDVTAQFMLNEKHRLQEGVLQCTTCHDPHEPADRPRLAGFKDETCLRCHTEKGGPFVHEHEASRIEGCVVCHEVHGSPNRHLLKHQNVTELCFSCHATAPSWHAYFTRGETNCVSCHTAIHGSNLDKLFLK